MSIFKRLQVKQEDFSDWWGWKISSFQKWFPENKVCDRKYCIYILSHYSTVRSPCKSLEGPKQLFCSYILQILLSVFTNYTILIISKIWNSTWKPWQHKKIMYFQMIVIWLNLTKDWREKQYNCLKPLLGS